MLGALLPNVCPDGETVQTSSAPGSSGAGEEGPTACQPHCLCARPSSQCPEMRGHRPTDVRAARKAVAAGPCHELRAPHFPPAPPRPRSGAQKSAASSFSAVGRLLVSGLLVGDLKIPPSAVCVCMMGSHLLGFHQRGGQMDFSGFTD